MIHSSAIQGVKNVGQESFVADQGWRSQGGSIVFDAGRVLEDGWFECTMSGWFPPASGADKSHPLSGRENANQFNHYDQLGSFWNWRIGTGYFPFKVLAAPQTIESRVEARVGDPGHSIYLISTRQIFCHWQFDRQPAMEQPSPVKNQNSKSLVLHWPFNFIGPPHQWTVE